MGFNRYHPIILFLYFISIFLLIMTSMNPILLIISLILSLIINIIINQDKFLKSIKFFILIFIIILITNPFFSKNGQTVLFTILDYKFYYESLLYGFFVGIMFISMISWFQYYNEIMTSDKFIYLFGRFIPTISLIISMGLKLIPNYKDKLNRLSNTQKTMGLDNRRIKVRIINGLRKINSLISWSLENAINTSEAMKARGYGIGKRSSFSLFKFKKNDSIFLFFWIILMIIIVYGILRGYFEFNFYPTVDKIYFRLDNLIMYCTIIILYSLPIIIETKEVIKWHYLKSKI